MATENMAMENMATEKKAMEEMATENMSMEKIRVHNLVRLGLNTDFSDDFRPILTHNSNREKA